MSIHESIAGKSAGRKFGVGCLNKGAIVLTCAVWEAFIEDLCEEAVEHVATHLNDPTLLPDDLKQAINKELAIETSKIWNATCGGWQVTLRNHLKTIKGKYWEHNAFNSPKPDNVDNLFNKTLGLNTLSDSWRWQGATADRTKDRLIEFIELRGDIAHRNASSNAINKTRCQAFLQLVLKLAEKTDEAVNTHVHNLTGEPLF